MDKSVKGHMIMYFSSHLFKVRILRLFQNYLPKLIQILWNKH